MSYFRNRLHEGNTLKIKTFLKEKKMNFINLHNQRMNLLSRVTRFKCNYSSITRTR